jgi:hypothetical protein
MYTVSILHNCSNGLGSKKRFNADYLPPEARKKVPFPLFKETNSGKKKGLARVQDHPDNCWALAISVCKNLPLFEDYGTEQRTALQWTV